MPSIVHRTQSLCYLILPHLPLSSTENGGNYASKLIRTGNATACSSIAPYSELSEGSFRVRTYSGVFLISGRVVEYNFQSGRLEIQPGLFGESVLAAVRLPFVLTKLRDIGRVMFSHISKFDG